MTMKTTFYFFLTIPELAFRISFGSRYQQGNKIIHHNILHEADDPRFKKEKKRKYSGQIIIVHDTILLSQYYYSVRWFILF